MARKANTRKQRTPQQQKAARDAQKFIRQLYQKNYPELSAVTELATRAALMYGGKE